eukprot:scaffold160075_cov18-Tisochrysis_lutea.AAC.3
MSGIAGKVVFPEEWLQPHEWKSQKSGGDTQQTAQEGEVVDAESLGQQPDRQRCQFPRPWAP